MYNECMYNSENAISTEIDFFLKYLPANATFSSTN